MVSATIITSTTTTTTTVTSTTTTTILADRKLGIVSNCTLVDAEKIDVYSGEYCVVNQGQKSRSEAFLYCKTLNARLPLPKNEAEMAAFLKLSPNKTWIGITDPVKGRN